MYGIVCYLSLGQCKETFDKFINIHGGHYIGILHDRDVDKIDHCHLLLSTTDTWGYSSLRNELKELSGTQTNFLVNNIRDIVKSLEYLVHANNPRKAQYDKSCVFFDSSQFWKEVYTSPPDMERDFLDDLLSPEFSFRAMGMKYGKDFIKNAKAYVYFRDMVNHEEHERELEECAYRRAIEEQRRKAEARQREIERILELFPELDLEIIGDYTYADYENVADWVRQYKRANAQTVKVYYLLKLPHADREALERLIYSRMKRGIGQYFYDDDPKYMGTMEMYQNFTNPVMCQIRPNIYINEGVIL